MYEVELNQRFAPKVSNLANTRDVCVHTFLTFVTNFNEIGSSFYTNIKILQFKKNINIRTFVSLFKKIKVSNKIINIVLKLPNKALSYDSSLDLILSFFEPFWTSISQQAKSLGA